MRRPVWPCARAEADLRISKLSWLAGRARAVQEPISGTKLIWGSVLACTVLILSFALRMSYKQAKLTLISKSGLRVGGMACMTCQTLECATNTHCPADVPVPGAYQSVKTCGQSEFRGALDLIACADLQRIRIKQFVEV